jgi:hypothetical protein
VSGEAWSVTSRACEVCRVAMSTAHVLPADVTRVCPCGFVCTGMYLRCVRQSVSFAHDCVCVN